MSVEKTIEVAALKNDQHLRQLINHQSIIYGYHGAFCLDLMKMGACSPCVPDGEDASGRQKFRLLTPEEVVARSVEITQRAFAAMAQNGWVTDQPPLSEIIESGGEVGFSPRKAAA